MGRGRRLRASRLLRPSPQRSLPQRRRLLLRRRLLALLLRP